MRPKSNNDGIFIFKDLLDEIIFDLKKIKSREYDSVSRFYMGDCNFGSVLPKARSSKFLDIPISFERSKGFFVESFSESIDPSELSIELYVMCPDDFEDMNLFYLQAIKHISYHLMKNSISGIKKSLFMKSDFDFSTDIDVGPIAFSSFVDSFYSNKSIEFVCFRDASFYFEPGSFEYNILVSEMKKCIRDIFEKLYKKKEA